MTPDQAALRQAEQVNHAMELEQLLQCAYIAICNASQIMTVSQRSVWAERNARSVITGNVSACEIERAAGIAKATGNAA